MKKVNNGKCIRNISKKSLKKARLRNGIAIFAIALTAMLFTAIFTIAISVNSSFQEQNFRQAGGDTHGTFKDVTEEQTEKLSSHPLISEYGLRLLLGMAEEKPFEKSQVEVSYMDKTCAKGMFCIPKEGRLPKEGTKEAATDTKVLKLLGVEPVIGNEFTVTYNLGSTTAKPKAVTQTFTLCGYWEYDSASMASHIVTSKNYAETVLKDYERQEHDITGMWTMNVNFKNAYHIREDLNQVLSELGYQSEDGSKENYIGIGINWGYTGAQLSNSMDLGVAAGMAGALLLIVFTGYLIIYNIFRISVTGDIRFYGLLKTIGTTGKQIRGMIRNQAFILSIGGIPLGLLAGWAAGSVLTPVIMNNMSYKNSVISVSPWIFVVSAVFAFFTVFLSCRKPARLAGKVSPIEALRYTEISKIHKKAKKGQGGAKIYRMALSNLGRSKSRTALVILSLSLSVVLLNITFIFGNGFDMDLYLKQFVQTDFVFANAQYFRYTFGAEEKVPEDIIENINEQGGITESGRIYGQTKVARHYITKEEYEKKNKDWLTKDQMKSILAGMETDENGLVQDSAELYGMEPFPLSQVEVLEGELSGLEDAAENYIAAVVWTDDYDNPIEDSQSRRVGEKIKLVVVDDFIIIDRETGEEVTETTPEENMEMKVQKSHEEEFTVCARVTVPYALSYRRYGSSQYVVGSEKFKEVMGTEAVMSYVFNVQEKANADMEAFLKNFTENVQTEFGYESKLLYVNDFESFRNMFILMGSILSFVIGMIGMLNFVNAVVTSIVSRKREFALIQAVGMTGRQLKELLVLEGLTYGLGAIFAATLINFIMAPLISNVLSGMFWFYKFHFTILPILCMLPVFILMGILIPVLAYQSMKKQPIVERIRQAE